MSFFKKVVKKAVGDALFAPVKAVGSLLKGDVSKAADQALRGYTLGTVGVSRGSVINLGGTAPAASGVAESEQQATAELKTEADDTAKRRVALFATQGDELGEEVFSVGKKRRGLLGN